MLKISVFNQGLDAALSQLQTIADQKQFRFSVAKALTQTAADIQQEVRKNMPGRFIIRRPWVINGIRIERATPANLSATIYSRDKFMGLQELGGEKNPLRQYLAIPTSLVRRTKTDVIRKADRPKELGDKVEIIEFRGHKWLALKKARKAGNNQRLRLLYLLIPRAHINKRLGLADDAIKVARANFAPNLRSAIEYALRTAR